MCLSIGAGITGGGARGGGGGTCDDGLGYDIGSSFARVRITDLPRRSFFIIFVDTYPICGRFWHLWCWWIRCLKWHFAWRCRYILLRYEDGRVRLVVRKISWCLDRRHVRKIFITILGFHSLIFAVGNVKSFRPRRWHWNGLRRSAWWWRWWWPWS